MLAASAAPAHAEEPRLFSLSWVAPADCPNGDSVQARVDSLLGSTIESRLARPFQVTGTIVQDGSRMDLRLETNDNGLRGTRTISGASCDELASAGALVVALAIDPDAVAAHGGVPSAAFNADGTGAEGPRAAATAAPPPPAPPAGPWPAPAAAAPVAPAPGRARGVLGLRSVVDFGTISSRASLGGDLAAGFTVGRFLLRLDAKYFPKHFSEAERPDPKGADISLAASSLSACYVARNGRLGIGACAELEAGVFLAEGSGFFNDRADAKAWFAPGASGDLAVDIAEPLCLLVEIGALVPPKPPAAAYTNATGDSREIFKSWPVVARASIGLGVALE